MELEGLFQQALRDHETEINRNSRQPETNLKKIESENNQVKINFEREKAIRISVLHQAFEQNLQTFLDEIRKNGQKAILNVKPNLTKEENIKGYIDSIVFYYVDRFLPD